MALSIKSACGYSASEVLFTSNTEYAYLCGNTVVVVDAASGTKCLIKGTGFGIQTFAVNSKHHLVAVATKGPIPTVQIFNALDQQQIASIPLPDALGVGALALSSDGERLVVATLEPSSQLSVYNWRQEELLVSTVPPVGLRSLTQISFHPYDSDKVLTTGSNATLFWRIQRLYDKYTFKSQRLQLGQGSTEGHTCHAWHPEGAYIGTAQGNLYCLTFQHLAAGSGALREATPSPAPSIIAGRASSDGSKSPTPDASAAALDLASSTASLPALPHVQVMDSPLFKISFSRDLLIVGGQDKLVWLVHGRCALPSTLPVFYSSCDLGAGVGVAGMSLGGLQHNLLIVGCTDGKLLKLTCPAPPPKPSHAHREVDENAPEFQSGKWDSGQHAQDALFASMSSAPPGTPPTDTALDSHTSAPADHITPVPPPTATILINSHVGHVAKMVPHATREAVLTCGADGSLRMWDAPTGNLLAHRTFSSALTAMAMAPNGVPLLAVGSETGVLRLVVVNDEQVPGGDRPLHVTWRRRLHSAALTQAVFSPNGSMLATAGKDNCIWFMSVNAKEGTALPLGQITCPEPVLSMAWPIVQDAEDCVLVSLASGGVLAASAPMELHTSGKPTPSPGMQLTAKDVTMKVVKLEAALLSMVTIPGEKYGELLGLGSDGCIHQVELPTEGQAWSGLKGRVHKSSTHTAVHALAHGCIAITQSMKLLVSGSKDGTIAVHSPGLQTMGTLAEGAYTPSMSPSQGLAAFRGGLLAGLHDTTLEGTCAVAFDQSGRYILSCGSDGSIFVYETKGGAHITRQLPRPPGIVPVETLLLAHVTSGAAPDADQDDELQEVGESTAVNTRAAAAAKAVVEVTRTGTAHVAARLEQLKAAVLQCVQDNQDAPELEKVDRNDFLINRQLLSQLQSEADTTVQEVKVSAFKTGAALEVIAGRVLDSCWNHMGVRGEHIAGVNNPTITTSNFPISKVEDQERILTKITFLRRMEMLEERQVALAAVQASVSAPTAASTAPPAAPAAGPNPTTPVPGAGGEAAAATAPAPPPPPPAISSSSARQSLQGGDLELPEDLIDQWTNAGGEVDLDQLMYKDSELYTMTRKSTQAYLLKHKIIRVCAAFNEDWSKTAKNKKACADKIADLNSRMEEIVKDLGKLGAPAPPADELRFVVPFPEDMKHVLHVRDEEVQVEYDADGGAGGGSGGPGRQGGQAALSGGEQAAAERALRQMMGGTLAARDDDNTEFVLIRPDWMNGNPKLFSEEQMKEFKDFQIKEKILAEEKGKRISTLELELRTVVTAMEEAAAHFDGTLQALGLRRAKASMEIAALETKAIQLMAALDQCAASGETAVKEVLTRMSHAKDQHSKIVAELTDKSSILAQMEAQLGEVTVEDKALEKNFKKEFSHADQQYAQLLHLFRLRLSTQEKEHHKSHRALHHTNSGSEAAMSINQHYQGGHGRTGTASTATRAMAIPAQPSHPPVSPLMHASRHPALVEAQSNTLNPWPELPPSVAALIPTTAQAPGGLPPHQEEEPEYLPEHMAPESLASDTWEAFNEYRASKVRCEQKLRRLHGSLHVLKLEVPQLDAGVNSLQAIMDGAMNEVQQLHASRKAALHDCVIQLRLKAGQVEVCPGPGQLVAQDDAQALLLDRQRVEALNASVRTQGEKKVQVLRAMKDFSRGTHQLRWEAASCDLRISELREKVRDLQLLHVTRDMQAAYQAGGQEARAADKQQIAAEQASLENLAKQRDKLHKKALIEREHSFAAMAGQIQLQAGQNTDVARHLVQLQKVLHEQQRLRRGMVDSNQAAGNKMRSMVTHKKLKEIAIAQAEEVRALAAELDRLRLRTYPTFVERTVSHLPADNRIEHSMTVQSPRLQQHSPAGLLPLNKSHPHLNFSTGDPLRQ